MSGRLRAEVSPVLGARKAGKEYRRVEKLALFLEPHGNEIAVEVYDAVLDFPSLAVVAEYAAIKLNTGAGRAALKLASEGSKRSRRRGPYVRVPLPGAWTD